jgi:molecular chaperone DnaK
MLKEHRDKVSESDAKNVEAALEEAKKAIQEGDVSKISAAVDRLTTASHKLAEAMYKHAAPSGAGPAPGAEAGPATAETQTPPKGDGEVIDAEVVDDDKKKN